MTDFRYGPVDLHLIGFEGDRPDPGVVQALVDLLEGGLVRLLDFVIISRGEDGTVTVTEVEDAPEEYGFGAVEFEAVGIAGDDDIAEFAEHIPPGGSAALVALELAFARSLAGRLAASGAVVLRSERIPAPVVNAIVDAVDAVEGD
jgi:uncharacterized membrane protein